MFYLKEKFLLLKQKSEKQGNKILGNHPFCLCSLLLGEETQALSGLAEWPGYTWLLGWKVANPSQSLASSWFLFIPLTCVICVSSFWSKDSDLLSLVLNTGVGKYPCSLA